MCIYIAMINKTIHVYIQNDLVKAFEKKVKKRKVGEGTYINQLIRKDLKK